MQVLGSSAGSGRTYAVCRRLIPVCHIRCLSSKRPVDSGSHYDVLGIKRDAKQKDVKDAFYRLSKLYHPDVSTDKVALQKFQDITAAYETLGTEETRAAYDAATAPLRNQRLTSAPPARKTETPDDYTQSYRMRKRAHEKIRIRTQAEAAGTADDQQSRPRHYAAGVFDENVVSHSVTDPEFDMSQKEEQLESSGIGGFTSLFVVFGVVLIALCRSEAYVLKGHKLRLGTDDN